jgi:hypothetical protein
VAYGQKLNLLVDDRQFGYITKLGKKKTLALRRTRNREKEGAEFRGRKGGPSKAAMGDFISHRHLGCSLFSRAAPRNVLVSSKLPVPFSSLSFSDYFGCIPFPHIFLAFTTSMDSQPRQIL